MTTSNLAPVGRRVGVQYPRDLSSLLLFVSRELAPSLEEIRRRLNETTTCINTISGGDGIDVTGFVVSVDFAPNPALEFVAGQIRVQIADGTLSRQATGLRVEGLNPLFTIAATPVGATVTAANLTTLTDTSNADALHTHTHIPSNVPATDVGQILHSSDGVTFVPALPVTTVQDGWLVTDEGYLLVQEGS